MVNKINNKRGWIRLVEVFIAIVLLTSILLVISRTNSNHNNEVQNDISKRELAVLRDIQLNDQLRAEILSVPISNLPVEWENFDDDGLPNVRVRIEELSPSEFYCTAKVCLINEICTLEEETDGEIYVKSVVISANSIVYSPRELKLFCVKD
jgi:hypothetical protein